MVSGLQIIFQKFEMEMGFQDLLRQIFRVCLPYFVENDFSDSKVKSKLNAKWSLWSSLLHSPYTVFILPDAENLDKFSVNQTLKQ